MTPSSFLNIKRRFFLKGLMVGTATLPWGWRIIAQTTSTPSYRPVDKMPLTPFDGPAGTWTLVVLPDTQYYCGSFPEVFLRQTEWIVKNKERHNILFVAHEGDITGRNTREQWEVAQRAMRVLDEGKVPYALVPGNHDLGENGKSGSRDTFLNDYFQDADYRNSPAHALFEPGKMENSWHEFDTPTGKYLMLALEYGPRDGVLEWANRVVAEHPNHRVIVVTHAHIYYDSTRYDWERYGKEQKWNPKGSGIAQHGSVNDGEAVWKKLLSRHANIDFVLNGHVLGDGTGYLVSEGRDGKKVHQILANYQDSGKSGGQVIPARGMGGGGFLRLMQFLPDGKTVRVRSYSPWYDVWLDEEDQKFTVTL